MISTQTETTHSDRNNFYPNGNNYRSGSMEIITEWSNKKIANMEWIRPIILSKQLRFVTSPLPRWIQSNNIIQTVDDSTQAAEQIQSRI